MCDYCDCQRIVEYLRRKTTTTTTFQANFIHIEANILFLREVEKNENQTSLQVIIYQFWLQAFAYVGRTQ